MHYLQPGDQQSCRCTPSQPLEIYCYKGRSKHILHSLETVLLQLNCSPNNYDLYIGSTPDQVVEQFESHHSSWSLDVFQSQTNTVELNPFNQSCVGVYYVQKAPYLVELSVRKVDFWRVCMLLVAIILFMAAPTLCENSLFYYICGISVGIIGSFVILLFLISKLFPKRPLMYGFLVGGSTLGLYLVRLIWVNLQLILQQYEKYVLTYVGLAGFISFVICYRIGPVTDPRSKNLIKWTLQFAGLWLMLLSTHYQEAAFALMLTLLMVYNFPSSWITVLQIAWKRRFPPKPKLLTEDEYYEQGIVETKKGLDHLRGYCSSPECDTWKTVLKLKDPIRFAHFMTGNSHLNDDEILEYETESRMAVTDAYIDDSEED